MLYRGNGGTVADETMVTNILVGEETRERLTRYGEAVGAATYEEAVLRLLRGTDTESAFGSTAGWGPWSEADRLDTRDGERRGVPVSTAAGSRALLADGATAGDRAPASIERLDAL